MTTALRRRWALAATLALAATGLAACSSPPPRLYTVVAAPGTIRHEPPKVIVVREVALAQYLQQQPIVRSRANYRLDVMSNDWWGEPPAGMLTRVLVDDLSQRLPHSSIFSESGAVASPSDVTVEVNITRLDEDTQGNLVLDAQAALDTKARTQPRPRSFHTVVTPPSRDVAGEVAAISTALGRLADEISLMLTSR